MTYLLALDQGTTSSRSIIFDPQGDVAGVGQREFTQFFPQPGWVEHDPEEIWESQLATVQMALEGSGIPAAEICAIGITNQRETSLLWDRQTGVPIAPAIVWQDRRTASMCDRLREQGHTELIRSRTGLEVDAYFSATKIAWLLENVDGARARAEAGEICFGTIDSWLLFRLTDGALHATDFSNASRTMLFDIHRGCWDEELCSLLEIPLQLLPDVRPSSGVFGSAAIDPLRGIPIAGVAGDQQAALFGQRCFDRGLAKCTYGTGCFLLANTGHGAIESKHRLLTTVAWQQDNQVTYALEGSVFIGGAAVQWLRDGLGLIEKASDIEDLARSVDSSDGVVFVPALAGLGAPHWDPHARGSLFGITRGTTKAHLARAALEGMALQVSDLVSAIELDAEFSIRELRVDGGASQNSLLMQIQADLLGIPVVRPSQTESTALGAALLAGRAVGLCSDLESEKSPSDGGVVFEPSADSEIDRLRDRWRLAIERSREWMIGTT